MTSSNQQIAGIKKFVVWPPKVQHIVQLGHLYDESGNSYPRDGGRSTELHNGHVLWQFNDTFCHNATGQFLGVSENNAALGSNFGAPTRSRYMGSGTSSSVPITEQTIPVLVQRFKDEVDKKKERACIWTFGGVAWHLLTDYRAYGWNFFEMHKVKSDLGFSDRVDWVGIAAVTIDYSSDPPTIEAEREGLIGPGRILFAGAEPRLGTFSVHTDGIWLYAYGHEGGEYNDNHDIVLGRVLIEQAKGRCHWKFWGGQVKQWVDGWRDAVPVLNNMQHGNIFKTKLFGERSPYKYGFVGCAHTGDSQVMFGRAENPWGPFEVVQLMTASPLITIPNFQFTYCMYAHPWAFPQSNGDLMITWSEGGPTGNIVAVKVRFETGIGVAQPSTRSPIQRLSDPEYASADETKKSGEQKAGKEGKLTLGKKAGALLKLLGKENK